MAKAVKKPRKKANGYQMPDPLPAGEILIDIAKKQWRLGSSIAKGGFGEIYACQEAGTKSAKFPFVIKVEPHENGPLFVEKNFYVKNAKLADVEAFMKKHKLKSFGMPVYYGSGSHEVGSTKWRFIVMEKFGADVDKLRMENNGALPVGTVFQLGWQITYVLEYIHELGYIHADIKGGNVLLGNTTENKNQSYLLDFGLATRYSTEKVFKPDPKRAHNGTIEYLSRDAHHGVSTRRGDFEILAYNLIHWLGGTLPWDNKLGDPKIVQQMKEESLKDIPKFVKKCVKKNFDTITKFLQYVNSLEFNAKPDYQKIRTLFEKEVEKNGGTVHSRLELTNVRKRRSVVEDAVNEEPKTEEIETEVKKPARKREKKQKENTNVDPPEEVMTEAMKEVLLRKKEKEMEKKKKTQTKKTKVNGDLHNGNEFEGYNAEMIEVKMKKMEREASRSPINDNSERRPRRHVRAVNYYETPLKAGKLK